MDAIPATSLLVGGSTVAAPTLTYLFSATVNLGKHLAPIPLIEGGQRIVEPLVSGTIYGPAFNATIEGGLAAPIVINNSTGDGSKSQMAFIYAYGHADDGSPFYVGELGIGTSSTGLGQNTRLIVNVGGKYKDLAGMYILGQPRLNEDRSAVKVECFGVSLPS